MLRHTAAEPDVLRIRFTSPHPSDMSERVIEAMTAMMCRRPRRRGVSRAWVGLQQGDLAGDMRRLDALRAA